MSNSYSDPSRFNLSRLVISVYLPAILFSMGWGMVVPVIPLFAKQMGATIAVAGAVVTMRGIGTLALDLPAGMLVASLGNYRTMLLSSVGIVMTALLTGFTHNVAVLAVLTFFLGGFQSAWMMSRLHYVRQTVAIHQRGRALSLIGGSFRIGSFIGPIIGGVVGKYLGLAEVYLVQCGIAFVALVLILATRRFSSGAEEPQKDAPTLGRIASVAVSERVPLLTGGLVILTLGVLRSSRQILVPLWGSFIGLDVGSIGLVLGLSYGLEMFMFYLAGVIMDRLGRKWAMIPCLAIFSLSFFLLPLTGTFLAFLAVALLTGLGNSFGSGIVMTLGADFAPDAMAGEFLGLWRSIGDVGTAAGPAVVGAIGQAVSLSVAPLFAAIAGVVGIVIMYFFVPETRTAKGRPPLFRSEDDR